MKQKVGVLEVRGDEGERGGIGSLRTDGKAKYQKLQKGIKTGYQELDCGGGPRTHEGKNV